MTRGANGGHPRQSEATAEEWSRIALAEGLRWAVLLKMHALRGLGSDTARRRRLPPSVAANIYRGDAIMFTSKSWKSTALGFDAFAWALAYLAYSPGGVTALGVHWCTGGHEDCPHAVSPASPDPRVWREPLGELDELARAEGFAPGEASTP